LTAASTHSFEPAPPPPPDSKPPPKPKDEVLQVAFGGMPVESYIREAKDRPLDRGGWPARWGDPTYLGDGPWGA